MLQESFSSAETDMHVRAVVEARVDADRMMLAARGALEADGDLLDADQRAEIEQQVRQLRSICDLTDAQAIEAATQALAKATEAFAAMRMNLGIQRALSGKNIASI